MSKLWLYIILVFAFQEQASTSALFLYSKEHQLRAWPLLVTWTLLSILDICVAYFLGEKARTKLRGTTLGSRLDAYAKASEKYLGSRLETLMIILFGIVNFPYLNGFFAAWLQLSFPKIFILLLFGSLIAFLINWETVSWVTHFIPNPFLALLLVLAASFTFSKLLKLILRS